PGGSCERHSESRSAPATPEEPDEIVTSVADKLEPGPRARFGTSRFRSQAERRIARTILIHSARCAQISVIPGGDFGNFRAALEQHTQRDVIAIVGIADDSVRNQGPGINGVELCFKVVHASSVIRTARRSSMTSNSVQPMSCPLT